MPERYAIHITPDNFALIRVLNRGGLVAVEEKPTYFIFDVNTANKTENHEIKFEEDLYDENGHLKDDLVILI